MTVKLLFSIWKDIILSVTSKYLKVEQKKGLNELNQHENVKYYKENFISKIWEKHPCDH